METEQKIDHRIARVYKVNVNTLAILNDSLSAVLSGIEGSANRIGRAIADQLDQRVFFVEATNNEIQKDIQANISKVENEFAAYVDSIQKENERRLNETEESLCESDSQTSVDVTINPPVVTDNRSVVTQVNLQPVSTQEPIQGVPSTVPAIRAEQQAEFYDYLTTEGLLRVIALPEDNPFRKKVEEYYGRPFKHFFDADNMVEFEEQEEPLTTGAFAEGSRGGSAEEPAYNENIPRD